LKTLSNVRCRLAGNEQDEGNGTSVNEGCSLVQDNALLMLALTLIEAINEYQVALRIRGCTDGYSLKRGKGFDKELSELILK
jgi:hypothetical protein